MGAPPKSVGATELALWLNASRGGGSTYGVYLVGPGDVAAVIEEVVAELSGLDDQLSIDIEDRSPSAAHFIHKIPSMTKEMRLLGVESYGEEDWRLLDRRRSSLGWEGVTVFFTTPASFASLMRVAPNLASWLGGFVFQHEDPAGRLAELREQRLGALREAFGKTDQEVIQQAEAGTLPRDPAFAEWLVLLGRGDLLDA